MLTLRYRNRHVDRLATGTFNSSDEYRMKPEIKTDLSAGQESEFHKAQTGSGLVGGSVKWYDRHREKPEKSDVSQPVIEKLPPKGAGASVGSGLVSSVKMSDMFKDMSFETPNKRFDDEKDLLAGLLPSEIMKYNLMKNE